MIAKAVTCVQKISQMGDDEEVNLQALWSWWRDQAVAP